MKKHTPVWLSFLVGALCLFLMVGCGGSSSEAQSLVDDGGTTPPGGGTPPPGGDPPELGALTDLGDLVAPDGDNWYFTKPAAINDIGLVVGASNNGLPVHAAFSWDPATGTMTFLGIHTDSVYIDRNGDPFSFIFSEAVAVNNAGDIVGNSIAYNDDGEVGTRAFIYKGGVFYDLPPLLDGTNGAFSKAVDINERGEVVLGVGNKDGSFPVYWDGNVAAPVVYRSLGTIVGEDAEPVSINENGQVAINAESSAVFYDLNWDVLQVLGHLPGMTYTVVVDINDSATTNHDGFPDGHIIGNSGNGVELTIEGGDVRGFFWDGGAMVPVDDLGGGASVVTDINDLDQVVGAATTDEGGYHAILWSLDPTTERGVVVDLGTLGGEKSYATSINEAGQVTGWSETGEFYNEGGVIVAIRHAFLWSDGTMYDLGAHDDFYDYPFTPSYPLSQGIDINEAGEVAGSSFTINHHHRGFYLSPAMP